MAKSKKQKLSKRQEALLVGCDLIAKAGALLAEAEDVFTVEKEGRETSSLDYFKSRAEEAKREIQQLAIVLKERV